MTRVWCLVVFLLAAPGMASAWEIAELSATMSQHKTFHGQFTQHKYLEDLPLPLVSHGVFHYDRNSGITWQVQEPVSSTLHITESGFASPEENLPRAMQQASAVSRLLLQILSGDLAALHQRFQVQTGGSLEAWQLDLQPRDETLASRIEQIRLKGGHWTQRVEIWETGGDRTEISFQRVSAASEDDSGP